MLIDEIKPEILAKLDTNYEEFNLCVNSVYDKLSTTVTYGQLDISDVRDIITFGELSTSAVSYTHLTLPTILLV